MALKYALVHEWLTPKATGGSELVVQEILKGVDADIYALIDFESTNPDSYLFKRPISTTFLQHLPFARDGVQKYLPLLPLAIEQLDLRGYDVILSSSHAVAKGVLTSANQLHVCYCHAPMRYAWDMTFDYLQTVRRVGARRDGSPATYCTVCGSGMCCQLIESITLLPTPITRRGESGAAIVVQQRSSIHPLIQSGLVFSHRSRIFM